MNPWQVNSLDDFNFLCCPECVFRSKESHLFESHAVLNHPQSSVFFNEDKEDFKAVNGDFEEVQDNDEHFDDNEPLQNTTFSDPEDFLELKIIPEDHVIEPEAEVEPETQQDSKTELHDFLETVEPEKPAPVKIEPKATVPKVDESDSEDELLIVKLNYNFKCIYCPERFPTAGRKAYHIRRYCTLKKFTCLICKAEFKKIGGIRMHQQMFHPNQCPECGEKCGSRDMMRIHIQKAHREPKKPAERVPCKICQKTFTTKSQMQKHVKAIHGDKTKKKYHCIICGYKSHTYEYFHFHDLRYHIENDKYYFDLDDIRVDNDGNVQCPTCEKIMYQSKYFLHHKDKHKTFPPNWPDHRKFMCSNCPDIFTRQKSLDSHVKKFHEGYTEECFCHQCGKKLSSEYNLKLHLKRRCGKVGRRGKGPGGGPKLIHECTYCPIVFKSKECCQEHIKKVHENDTPFQCDECPMSFGLEAKLRNHKVGKHTRRQCDICFAVLYNYNNLKNHKYQVHKVIPEGALICQICDKIFLNKGFYKNHMASKHGM